MAYTGGDQDCGSAGDALARAERLYAIEEMGRGPSGFDPGPPRGYTSPPKQRYLIAAMRKRKRLGGGGVGVGKPLRGTRNQRWRFSDKLGNGPRKKDRGGAATCIRRGGPRPPGTPPDSERFFADLLLAHECDELRGCRQRGLAANAPGFSFTKVARNGRFDWSIRVRWPADRKSGGGMRCWQARATLSRPTYT